MKAVLIIDMLEDFFRRGVLLEIRKQLTNDINVLTDQARRLGLPVIWVRQEFRDDLQDAFLIMRKRDIRITIEGTEGSQILGELVQLPGDYEVVKKRYSAYYGTELDNLLHNLDVTELIIVGINTHACVRTTAIDAYQRDLEVTIPRECVASNDLEHHEVTLRYLSLEMANVLDLDEVLTGLSADS